MTTSNGTGQWKWIAGIAATALLTIATTGTMSYAAFWRDAVTHRELEPIVRQSNANASEINAINREVGARLRAIEESQREIKELLRSRSHAGQP
jgi:aspartate/glutamate racemase